MNCVRIRATSLYVLAGFSLMLSACTTPRHRPDPTPASPAPEAITTPASNPQDQVPAASEPTEAMILSPWPRLRDRFALDSCSYSSAVLKEARLYTRSAHAFTKSLNDALPFLLLVIDELERRDLPGEFALLPYVESHYQPLPAKGYGAAGMWQLMGRTATDKGLQVSRAFDQRLDAIASTRVALDLIERYDREFGDWRLVTMAFNAGEFKVKRQIGNQATTRMGAKELDRLKLSPTTHQHLHRLLALACIIEQPQVFGVDLPAAGEADFLKPLVLASPIDLRLAARLLGLPLDELRRFNAAWRLEPQHIGPVDRLLVPGVRIVGFEEKLQLIPEDLRSNWHEQRLQAGDTLASLANTVKLDVEVLAMVNGIAADALIAKDSKILMPGPGSAAVSDNLQATYLVKQGDTLSAIAHRHGVQIAELLRWNNLSRNSVLALGMRLHIHAPQY